MGVFLAFALNSTLWAQTTNHSSSPAGSSGKATTEAATDSDEESEDQPFKPHWENEIQLSNSNQQAGQVSGTLAYTGTWEFNEAGDFLSGEVSTIRQKLEGTGSSIGTFTASGGLGLGFFSPSLSLGVQTGDGAWKQANTNLSLGFQIWDPVSWNLSSGGNLGSHQGPVSQWYPAILSDARIDTASWNISTGPTFVLWDWWSISLTAEYEYDVTYELQGLADATRKVPIDQADQIATLTLGLDFTLFKGFTLELAPQGGKEYYPSGAIYSPQAGGLVFNSSPSTVNFAGETTSISYQFE